MGSQQRSRVGLTLMELIVVLLILIGLASIVIPMIPNMLVRTHNSTGAVNMQEVAKWVQTYQAQYFSYPDQWDALTDGTTGLANYLPKDGAGALVAGDLTAGTLTPEELAALNSVGITSVHLMHLNVPTAAVAPDFSTTFFPYLDQSTAPAPTLLTAGTNLAFLSPAKAYSQLGANVTGRYVAFGLGQRCTIVGKTVAEAPVLFADQAEINPEKAYVRFAVIFKVSEGGVALPQATLAGTLHIAQEGLHGTNAHLREYYRAK